jgi:hypothetical protein
MVADDLGCHEIWDLAPSSVSHQAGRGLVASRTGGGHSTGTSLGTPAPRPQSTMSVTVVMRARSAWPENTGPRARRASWSSWQEATSLPRAGARNSSEAAAPKGTMPWKSSSVSQAAMIAANPAASTRVIRPLECGEPMTLVMAGGVTNTTSEVPSMARRTWMSALRWAGIGSSSERASAVRSIEGQSGAASQQRRGHPENTRFRRVRPRGSLPEQNRTAESAYRPTPRPPARRRTAPTRSSARRDDPLLTLGAVVCAPCPHVRG